MAGINDYLVDQTKPPKLIPLDTSNIIDALYLLLDGGLTPAELEIKIDEIIALLQSGMINNPVESSVAIPAATPIELNKQQPGITLFLVNAVAGGGIRISVSTASGVSGYSPQIVNANTGASQDGLITANGIYVLSTPFKWITISSEDGVTPQDLRVSLGNK